MTQQFNKTIRQFGDFTFIACHAAKRERQNYLEEFKDALDTLNSLLKKNMLAPNSVVKMEIHYIGYPNLELLWSLLTTYFDLPYPSITLIGAHHLPGDFSFQISCTCGTGNEHERPDMHFL